jgi:hypothetical protein
MKPNGQGSALVVKHDPGWCEPCPATLLAVVEMLCKFIQFPALWILVFDILRKYWAASKL